MQDSKTSVLKALQKMFFCLPVVLLYSDLAKASVPNTALCDHAAQTVARESSIPISVMRAITRTETGRSRNGAVEPWPWTVNMEGTGVWFETREEARAYVLRHFDKGARSFDVGCFQINYKWHGHAFTSIDQMFDPMENAKYAADFLNQLFSELGSWPEAAGAYHSRTEELALKYRSRFETMLAGLSPDNPILSHTGLLPQRQNSFPLLQVTDAKPQMGSLVPSAFASRGSLFSTIRSGN